MKITDLRIGNIVDYETIYYRVDSLVGENKVILTAINHEWEPEPAGIAEIVGIPLTPEILKTLGFEPLNKKTTHLWIKNVGGYRYIRYHDEVHYMEFEHLSSFARVPWAIKEFHQMQNACTDYGLDVKRIFPDLK